jgi:hypothetical protein
MYVAILHIFEPNGVPWWRPLPRCERRSSELTPPRNAESLVGELR